MVKAVTSAWLSKQDTPPWWNAVGDLESFCGSGHTSAALFLCSPNKPDWFLFSESWKSGYFWMTLGAAVLHVHFSQSVHQALLSRVTIMFSLRTWRQSLWLSFYNSAPCSKKEGLISFLQWCLCLNKSWRWQWFHSCILHILPSALVPRGGFISVLLLPKTLIKSRDVSQNQPVAPLKRFCVRILLNCSKLI